MKFRFREIGLAAVLGVACAAAQAHAAGRSGDPLQGIDTDHDGTIDMKEITTAAGAAFDRLDGDHDGTLDKRELKGRISGRELAAADPDHDGTLTKDEYGAMVETRFKAANRDADDTLDVKEFRSKPGKALRRLVK